MLSFSIDTKDVKIFMNKILKEEVFDLYQVRNVEIKSIARFEIDCSLDKDYLSENAPRERRHCKWSEIRPYVFNIIKGSAKPKLMKIVLSYDSELLSNFHPNAKALFLNIYFENDILNCTTATSQINFSLEKDLDLLWEAYVKDFFKNNDMVISTH